MPIKLLLITLSALVLIIGIGAASADPPASATASALNTDRPWANTALSPDERAAQALAAMTHEEKLGLVLGTSARPAGDPVGVAGYVPGVPRLGIPPLRESNAELGVAIPIQGKTIRPEDEATPLPSGLATAATWNPRLAYANGAMIGREARRKGFNVLLAGAVNLARDPRGGRNFEYAGEDPLLAGTMVGAAIRGIEDQHVISTIKHFALNDQESNRTLLDARIDPVALRESDLLAFELAIERGRPGAVMCAYNLVNGVHACENEWLLTHVLREDWRYPGWVMSDWGAVHSTAVAARAGLDQESGADWDSQIFFGEPLSDALAEGVLPASQLNKMARRVLRSMFASGVIDHPNAFAPLDAEPGARVAEAAARESIVLLRNRNALLPLSAKLRRIAVIGGHAEKGVISGGGSSQVFPLGGPALRVDYTDRASGVPYPMIFDPSSPLKAIRAATPHTAVTFDEGTDPAKAAEIARHSDVAIVFATSWELEGHDNEGLALPDDQDRLIATVATANPRTIVVLETGNPVLMPWRDQVGAIIEAWYPGARGGKAIADILFGKVNPSGHLSVTFPTRLDQLTRPALPGRQVAWNKTFPVEYSEGAAVGYKWFAARGEKPLYPFGFGLSYTSFRYEGLRLTGGKTVTARFTVTNTGRRTGAAVPQLYAFVPSPHGGVVQRLVGWTKLSLAPGESRHVAVAVDPRLLAHFDEGARRWVIVPGRYRLALGASADDLRVNTSARVVGRTLPP